jgi:hypothetical protein
LTLRKFFAALFIILIAAPFTEPWPVCPLRHLLGDPPVPVMLLAAPVEGAGQAAVRGAPASTEPDVTNPITLLPPLRTRLGTPKVSPNSALNEKALSSAVRIPISKATGVTGGFRLSIPARTTSVLRV